jgi:hypothetical protein
MGKKVSKGVSTFESHLNVKARTIRAKGIPNQ